MFEWWWTALRTRAPGFSILQWQDTLCYPDTSFKLNFFHHLNLLILPRHYFLNWTKCSQPLFVNKIRGKNIFFYFKKVKIFLSSDSFGEFKEIIKCFINLLCICQIDWKFSVCLLSKDWQLPIQHLSPLWYNCYTRCFTTGHQCCCVNCQNKVE